MPLVPATLSFDVSNGPEKPPVRITIGGLYDEETETLVRYVGQGGRKEIYSGVKYLVKVTPQDHMAQPTETLPA